MKPLRGTGFAAGFLLTGMPGRTILHLRAGVIVIRNDAVRRT
jgi:hypothetical protein